VALVFTGHDLSEGTAEILASIKNNQIKGSFFLTGDYLRTPGFKSYVRQMLNDGHMGRRYLSSTEIIDNLWSYEARFGLNGFLILIHMGTDDRRKDKLYHHLDDIISILKGKGYKLVDVPDLLK